MSIGDTMNPERPSELSLRLLTPSEAILGLPLFVEVTLANETEGAEYYDLAHCDPWSPPFPVSFAFLEVATEEGHAPRHITLPALSPLRGEGSKGFDLLPGESRTFSLDLSELDGPLAPGIWQVAATWVMRREKPAAVSMPLVLLAASPKDLSLVRELRGVGGGEPSWANMVKAPELARKGAPVGEASDAARRMLVPYLISYQAVQGPDSVVEFPADVMAPGQPGWVSEARLLTYELLWAKHAPELPARRQALLQRWPGLAFRVNEIERGLGILSRLRQRYGPEKG